MMVRATDIHSVTEFTRNAKAYIQQIKETRNPIALTVNGDAQVVVQDAESYQRMVDELEQSRFWMAIQEGEEDIRAGRTAPAGAVFARLRKKPDI